MSLARRGVAVVGMVAILAGDGVAQPASHGADQLGAVDFPTSCAPAATGEVNRAVALLHHMIYPEARSAFERIAAVDSSCAIAQWGIAMTLFQPLWPTRPGPDALERGWAAALKARRLGAPTERERLYLAMADSFFTEPASTDYWLRIRRWSEATARLAAAFPDDPDAAAFHALALLATPAVGPAARIQADRAAALLLHVYQQHPDHPGAMHYLVHANDTPGRERDSLAITHRYEEVAPENPHALHMPTHIYTRLGDWDGVIRGNRLAAVAALGHPAGDLIWDEYPHAVEYLVYGYLQRGEDDSAAAALHRLQRTEKLQPTFKTAFHLASTVARYALERRAWSEAEAIVPREPAGLAWDTFTWPEAIAWFARGLGAAHLGRRDEAQAAVVRLDTLEATTRRMGEALFATNIALLRLELLGWTAHGAGRKESAVALLREAAALEAATPKHAVTPGPTIPAEELLGDLLMEQKKPNDAVAAYRRALALYPRRFNTLLGAARASAAAGATTEAVEYYRQLLDVAGPSSGRPELAEAGKYLRAR